jgi:hypothetical protein
MAMLPYPPATTIRGHIDPFTRVGLSVKPVESPSLENTESLGIRATVKSDLIETIIFEQEDRTLSDHIEE